MHTAVEHPFRIDRNGRSPFALIETTRLVGANQLDAAPGELHFQPALKLALARRIAATARTARVALVQANENVLGEFRHVRLRARERSRADG